MKPKKQKLENYENLWNEIVIQGEKPQNGFLYVNPDGKVALSVIYRNTCYQKEFETGLETLKESDCGLGFVGIDTKAPEIQFIALGNPFNEFDWAREDFYVQIKIVDEDSGPISYKWCTTMGDTCNPETEYSSSIGTVLISGESSTNRVCVIGIDQSGKQSETICSDGYKLDKTAPNIEGLLDITINLKDGLDLETGINSVDFLSGIEGTVAHTPKDVDRTKTGVTDITYTVRDKAGNIGTLIKKVKTVADAPSVKFKRPENIFNADGWAREEVYIKVELIDYSGHGMKAVKWCTTTNTECEPISVSRSSNIEVNALIPTESNQNRVCISEIDNDNHASEVICSEVYKLDKTNPSLTGIGDQTVSRYANIDLTSGIVASDAMSGVEGSYMYTPTTVDTSRAGTINITYTVKDKAGNTQEYIRKIIVETEAPTVTFIAESGKINSNGWAKEDFLVTFTPNDQSGHGMKEFKWCATTNNSCDPTGNTAQTSVTGGATISSESASNRICIIATDNTGKVSTNICSDAYKLDKTAPVITGTADTSVLINGNINLTSGVSVVDTLSGVIESLSYNPTVVNTTAVGTTNIIYQTNDQAGNVGTATRVITVYGYTWQKYNTVEKKTYYWDRYSRNSKTEYTTVNDGQYSVTASGAYDPSTGPANYWLYPTYTIDNTGKFILNASQHIENELWTWINKGYMNSYPYTFTGDSSRILKYSSHTTISRTEYLVYFTYLKTVLTTTYTKGDYLNVVSSVNSSAYPMNDYSGIILVCL